MPKRSILNITKTAARERQYQALRAVRPELPEKLSASSLDMMMSIILTLTPKKEDAVAEQIMKAVIDENSDWNKAIKIVHKACPNYSPYPVNARPGINYEAQAVERATDGEFTVEQFGTKIIRIK